MTQPAPPSYDAPPSPPAPPRDRRTVVVAVAAAVAVLAVAVLVPVAIQRLGGDERRAAANLDEVRDYPGLHRDHTDKNVDYDQVPPAGGPHDPRWLACGAYGSPVRDENAVHDLEHGSVWISYQPDLPADDVATLAEALPHNGILAPYDELPAPVVVTVWGHQLRLTGADDPRLELFIATYGDGATAPEPFASCEGGLRGTGAKTGGAAV